MTPSKNTQKTEKRVLPATFWEAHYAENTLPWDLGEPALPFVQLMANQATSFLPEKMAVLGCGQGHDAGFFGKLGFDVTGFDYTMDAVIRAKERYGDMAQFNCIDIFQLPEHLSNTFDYVLEHTCLCALHPDLRPDYAALVQRLLKPGGQLIALFFVHGQPGGPPYNITLEEIQTLFSGGFKLTTLERTPHSHESRKGMEYLGVFKKKES